MHVAQVCHGLRTASSSSPLQVVSGRLVVPHHAMCADVEQGAHCCLCIYVAAVSTVLVVLQDLTLSVRLYTLHSTAQHSTGAAQCRATPPTSTD
jgi:hypothetical protein